MDVATFDEIAEEFDARVRRIVWCSAATVDAKGRPRQRILHPIWEGAIGWIATNRHSHKEKHLAKNEHVSLSYWDQQHQQIYADCAALWEDDPAEKRRIWDLYASTPPPLGYDPAMIWKDGPAGETFGLLKLTPWRIELSGMSITNPQPPRVWHAR